MFKFLGKRLSRSKQIRFISLPIPPGMETKHLLAVGTTGSGKTMALRTLLDSIRDRGDRAVLLDAGGDLMRFYFSQNDCLLSPGDTRSINWSPLSEITQTSEALDLAKSIIPDSSSPSGQEWYGYAQTLMASIIRRMLEGGLELTNASLLHYTTVAPMDELEKLVTGTPASRLFENNSARMLSSILSIVGLAMEGFSYLRPDAGYDDFSIRQWIESDDQCGWLWFPYRDSTSSSTLPVRRCAVDIVIRSILDLPPSASRRVWLILDELPAVGYLPRLADALARGRKYGLVVFAGIQSVAQVRGVYHQEGAQSLFSNFGSWLILRQGDAETAEYLSRHVGEREAVRVDSSKSDDGKQSASYRTHVDKLLLPSELQRLPDLAGYISLPGDYPITKVEVPIPPNREQHTVPFVPEDFTFQTRMIESDDFECASMGDEENDFCYEVDHDEAL